MATQQLVCTLEELWALQKFCRLPPSAPDYGREHSQRLMLDIAHGLLLLESRAAAEYVVWCTEDELWEITRVVPKDYTVGTVPVGRSVLVKVMAELLALQEEGESYDDHTSHHADQDAGGVPGTGAETDPLWPV